jgi:hypothetical protein
MRPFFSNVVSGLRPKSSPGRRRFRPAVEALEERAVPAVFSVTSLADSNDPGSGALRAAISASNATPGPNEIDILLPAPTSSPCRGRPTRPTTARASSAS